MNFQLRFFRSLLVPLGIIACIKPAFADYGKAPPATSLTNASTEKSNETESSAAIDRYIPKVDVQVPAVPAYLAFTKDQKIKPNDFWWPKILNLAALKKSEQVNPLGRDFSYAQAFQSLDVQAVRSDLRALMHQSQDWWPADYGSYGPFFIRMAWHSAGTYRAADGRGGSDGGQQRFEPLNSWPDNANLDKARRLLQPVVDKYYPNLSWADAMILAGDEAMRDMGFKTLGVAGGRVDDWTPDLVYWGPEDKFLASHRFDENGNLMPPLAASVMGLIYVNPEGADGKPNPLLSANHIRITFGRMGMNDEETVALIAGGHTFGKAHGAHSPAKCQTGPAPAGAPVEDQAIGWKSHCGKGNAEDTITSGLEGSWTPEPTKWTHDYLTNLYKYNWKLQKGPGGKFQWYAENLSPEDHAPDAHLNKTVPIMMLTTDLAIKEDPKYRAISTRFLKNPDEFASAFARAWFKLVHRDLGPKSRYLGSDFPKDDFIWQDPTTPHTGKLVTETDVAMLKEQVLKSKLTISDMVKTAWAAAATFRGTDMRGGVNGARIRLEPQKNWEVNEPAILKKNLDVIIGIQEKFNNDIANQGMHLSLADLIVIAGNAGVEEAAKKAGVPIALPFIPGRNDANQAQTDVQSFQYLKVGSDGFRNYFDDKESYLAPAQAFVDRADFLTLTVPEMTVLTGGLRVLGANYQNSQYGVFTDRVGTLTNDFFTNLMNSSTVWTLVDSKSGVFVGKDRKTGKQLWTATTQDLIFGSSSELRVVAFSYASPTAESRFVRDFARAWNKVMNLDRFDLVQH